MTMIYLVVIAVLCALAIAVGLSGCVPLPAVPPELNDAIGLPPPTGDTENQSVAESWLNWLDVVVGIVLGRTAPWAIAVYRAAATAARNRFLTPRNDTQLDNKANP